MRNVAVKKRQVNGGVRLSFFVQEGHIKPGEYQLVPVDEADDKNKRITELEAKLATRSPGVMPEAVKSLVAFAKDAKIYPEAIAAVEAYYAPPFVFDGTPGAYKTDTGDIAHVVACGRRTIAILNGGTWQCVLSDGTFPGGRITWRVSE